MTYPAQWIANSTDPNDKSGVATFKVEGVEYVIALNNVEDFWRIDRALDAAFVSGREHADTMTAYELRQIARRINPAGEKA